MNIFDDDHDEMRTHHLDDQTIEAILAGRRPQAGAADVDDLVGLVAEVRALASAPVPVPGPALAAIFADGLTIEKGDLSATAASNVTGPARQAAGLPKWRRKTMVGALLAKLAELGMVAKAGMAAGAITLSASAAAATGSLPDVVQNPVADAIESVSGINIPRSADDMRKDGEDRKDADHRVADSDVEGKGGEAPEQDNFGAGVSERASDGEPKEDGRAFGESVSSSAPKAPQATEPATNRPTASNYPGTTAQESVPTASNNPGTTAWESAPTAEANSGTTARESTPTSQPEGTPTAGTNPSSDTSYSQPESTPTTVPTAGGAGAGSGSGGGSGSFSPGR